MNQIQLTVEQARGLVIVAPKSEVRFYLTAVLFDFARGRCVATDGHILLAVNVSHPVEGKPCGAGEVIIRREDLHEISKGGKKTDTIVLQQSADLITLRRASGITIEVNPIDAEYPEYERVMPEPSGDLGNYNPVIVAVLERGLRLCCGLVNTNNIAQIQHNGESAGTLVFSGYTDRAIGIVMPFRRVDMEDPVQDFLKRGNWEDKAA